MSATLVGKAHIDVLVNAGAQLGLIADGQAARLVGGMLWHENHKSVNHRYEHLGEFEATPRYTLDTTEAQFHPVALLKVLDCYVYQACEHPGWDDSEAKAWCGKLRTALLARLPDDAKELRTSLPLGTKVPVYETWQPYSATPWFVARMDQVCLDKVGDVR